MVQGAPPSAPAAPGVRALQADATAVLGGRKELRRPKERAPRATRVDPAATLAAGSPTVVFAVPSSAAAGAAAAAPVAAAPVVPQPASSFQIGEDDNTSIPPDTHAAVGHSHVFATQTTTSRSSTGPATWCRARR